MIYVGARQFKSRLGYYLERAYEGERFLIKVRDKVKALLSFPQSSIISNSKELSNKELERKIKKLRKEGFIISGGNPYKPRPFTPIKMTPGPSSTEIIRQMRDEG